MCLQRRIWLWGVLFAILAASAHRTEAQTPGQSAARVNGEDIALAEFNAIVDLRPSPVPVSKELQREMRKAAIDMLIDDMLMRQFLRRNVAPANPAEVQKEYDKLHAALAKQKKTLEQFLLEGKMTAEQLRADVIARLQWKAYLQARYPEPEIKSYYEANKVFFDNVLVRASQILVKFSNNSPTAEEKLRAKAKIDTIRQEILTGKATFEDAARKYSDCPSRKDGGDLGSFPYKFIVIDPIARAAFSTKKGELTGVIATDVGYHLLKVTDRTPGEPSRFEDSRDAIRDVMAQESELYQRILTEQKKTAKIEVFVQ